MPGVLLSIPCLMNDIVRNDGGTPSDSVQIAAPLIDKEGEDWERGPLRVLSRENDGLTENAQEFQKKASGNTE